MARFPVTVDVEVFDKGCRACPFTETDGDYCFLFATLLDLFVGEPERCAACLAAEAAYKEGAD
jgi:hypothetical protein